MVLTSSRILSCEVWLILMRKTSAPASNSRRIMALSEEAGPSVARILMRRRRLMVCSPAPRRVAERRAGARPQEGLSRPFTAAVIVERVDVVKPRDQRALQQGFTTARRHVPPAFGGPAFGILVAKRDAHPARGFVQKTKVRRGRIVPQAHHHKRQRRQQTGGQASGQEAAGLGSFADHLAKLYQFFDDFARAGLC